MAYILGTDLDDVLFGTGEDDTLNGGLGNDWLFGGAGNDEFTDWQGADRFDGGEGDDTLTLYGAMYGQADADEADGGAGSDHFSVWNGGLAHRLTGGAGADLFSFGLMQTASEPSLALATVRITDFNEVEGDRLDVARLLTFADPYRPIVWHGAAPTDFSAVAGEATPAGATFEALDLWTLQQDGQTILFADVNRNGLVDAADLRVAFDGAPVLGVTSFVAGTLSIVGTDGDDALWGTVAAESLYGLAGDDTIEGGGGADRIDAGQGNDRVRAGFDGDPLDGDDYVDASYGDDEVQGGDGADELWGGTGSDLLFGGAGDDLLYADNYWLSSTNGSDLANHVNTLYGDAGDDTLFGGKGHDVLRGGAGNDRLISDGDDVLWGEDGDDTFHARGSMTAVVTATGGAGSDTYSFDDARYGNPVPQILVTDFAADDRIDVSGPLFRTVPALGNANPFDPLVGVLRLSRDGVDALLQWDRDGAAGSGFGWQTLARLQNVDPAVLAPANFIGPNITQLSGFNHAPVLVQPLADRVVDEDGEAVFTVPAGSFTDPDAGDSLRYVALRADGSALPAWLAFNPLTQTFTARPVNADVGRVDIQLYALDAAGLTASDVFSLTVRNVNDAPTVANPLPFTQYLFEDIAFSYTVPGNTFADIDAGDTLTYTADRPFAVPLPAWLSFDAATRTFSGTPGNADVGPVTLRVIATDTSGAQAATFLQVAVWNVNDAPVVAAALPRLALNEDAAFSYAMPAGTFVDVDAGDTLGLSVSRAGGGVLPAWLSFDAASRTFSGTPGNADVGTLDLVVRATDAAGASASTPLVLDVRNVNDAPVALADAASTRHSTAVTLNVLANDSDIDLGATLAVAAVTQAPHGSVAIGAGGALTYTPRALWNGSESFSYTVADGQGGSASATVTIAVAGGIVGTDAANTLNGSTAADSIEAKGGDDTVDAGNGNDYVSGGAGNDRLSGGGGNDALAGGTGSDTLYGGNNADVLAGGDGNDALYGGATNGKGDGSADTFVFNGAAANTTTNRDTVYGFEANAMDKFALDPALYAALLGGTTSGVDTGEFRASAGGTAADANDFLLYDTGTGTLYYDADGNGAGARVALATLVGLTGALDASDFTLVLPPLA